MSTSPLKKPRIPDNFFCRWHRSNFWDVYEFTKHLWNYFGDVTIGLHRPPNFNFEGSPRFSPKVSGSGNCSDPVPNSISFIYKARRFFCNLIKLSVSAAVVVLFALWIVMICLYMYFGLGQLLRAYISAKQSWMLKRGNRFQITPSKLRLPSLLK